MKHSDSKRKKLAKTYQKVQALVDNGSMLSEACRKFKITPAVYRHQRRIALGTPRKQYPSKKVSAASISARKTASRKQPQLIHLAVPESPALDHGEVTVAVFKMNMAKLADFLKSQ